MSHIITRISQAIATLPEQTQLSLAIIKNGQTHYHGMIKKDNTIHETDNAGSAFEIGSVTKAFTGHALAQLAVENKVQLDDLIEQYLPFPTPAITLKQLALHTSGLPRNPQDFETQSNYDKNDPFKNYTEQQLSDYFTHNLQMDSEPGEKHQYSNLGAGLLSYIIGRIEGKPFAEVVAERIFKPLHMHDSSFDIKEIKTEIVRGIDDQGQFCHHWDGGILNGCLGIISTARDLVKYTLMTNDLTNTAANLQTSESFVVDPIITSHLGWGERLMQPENVRMLGVNGGTGGYGASILSNREGQCAVVILSNIWPLHYMDLIYPLGKELLIEISNG